MQMRLQGDPQGKHATEQASNEETLQTVEETTGQSLAGTLARLISYPVERVHHASVAQPG